MTIETMAGAKGREALKALQGALAVCRRIRDETTFSAAVTEAQRMTHVATAEACWIGINELMKPLVWSDEAPAKAPTMDAVEAVARALYVAKGAHNVFGPWEAQLYQSLKEPFRRQAKALAEPIIAEALSAARPLIAAECAKVAEKRADERFADLGSREPDTNATYYSGRYGEIYEALDEEDYAIATAIKETIR